MFNGLMQGLVEWLIWRLGRRLEDEHFLKRWGLFLYVVLASITMTIVIVYGLATGFNTFAVVAIVAASGALAFGAWTLLRNHP